MSQIQTDYNTDGFVKRLFSGTSVIKTVRERTPQGDNGLYVIKKTYSNGEVLKENVLFEATVTGRVKLQELNTEAAIEAFMFSV